MSDIDLIDRYYASVLGCSADDLNSDRLSIVASENRNIRFAKGVPLALFALLKKSGGVFSIRPDLVSTADRVLQHIESGTTDDNICDTLKTALSPLIDVRFWFRGSRLYCGRETFTDLSFGEVRITTHEDEHSIFLHNKWGGEVYSQIVDDKTVSWAAIKPLSDVIWDLSIETLEEYRGRGYAKSVVSSTVRHILDNDRFAGWGCDRINTASLRTAHAVGFTDYCLDFGCVEKTA